MMNEPDGIVSMSRIEGKVLIEVPRKAIETLGLEGNEDVEVYIDPATKRLIYQF